MNHANNTTAEWVQSGLKKSAFHKRRYLCMYSGQTALNFELQRFLRWKNFVGMEKKLKEKRVIRNNISSHDKNYLTERRKTAAARYRTCYTLANSTPYFAFRIHRNVSTKHFCWCHADLCPQWYERFFLIRVNWKYPIQFNSVQFTRRHLHFWKNLLKFYFYIVSYQKDIL